MPPTHSDLVSVLEGFMLRCPDGQRDLALTTIGPVSARLTHVPSPAANLAGLKLPTQHLSDQTLLQVRQFFAARHVPFGWLVGPNSPPDLGQRLQALGFSIFEEFAGLALTNLTAPSPLATGVVVREVRNSERQAFASTFASAFGLPMVAVDFMCDCFFFASGGPRARGYLAFMPGEQAAVGAAATVYDEAKRTVVLAGAAVSPAHRKRGIYTALLHKRLADARDDDMQAAVIQAVRATSAPICTALGFKELCSQTIYAWSGSNGGAHNRVGDD